MRLNGTSMFIIPDPFGGRTIEIEIEAREIGRQSFNSAADAQRVVASAPIITLRGHGQWSKGIRNFSQRKYCHWKVS
jgi:hypothetical protein